MPRKRQRIRKIESELADARERAHERNKSDDSLFFIDTGKGKASSSSSSSSASAEAITAAENEDAPRKRQRTKKAKASWSEKQIDSVAKRVVAQKRAGVYKPTQRLNGTEHLTGKAAQRRVRRVPISKSATAATAPTAASTYDLWGAEGGDGFTVAVAPGPNSRRKARTRPKVDKYHPSRVVPAVVKPHPGSSVNPEAEAHQDALGEAVAHELKFVQKRKDEIQAGKIPPSVYATLQSLGDGIPDSDDEGEEAGSGGDASAGAGAGAGGGGEGEQAAQSVIVKPDPHVAQTLTRAQLNKRARHQAKLEAAAKRKEEKKFLNSIHKAPAVIKELVEADKASQEAVERRQETRLHRLMNPKAKFAGKAIEQRGVVGVALTDELTGSMRTTKVLTVQEVMKDRLATMQRRQLLLVGKRTSKLRKNMKKVKANKTDERYNPRNATKGKIQ